MKPYRTLRNTILTNEKARRILTLNQDKLKEWERVENRARQYSGFNNYLRNKYEVWKEAGHNDKEYLSPSQVELYLSLCGYYFDISINEIPAIENSGNTDSVPTLFPIG